MRQAGNAKPPSALEQLGRDLSPAPVVAIRRLRDLDYYAITGSRSLRLPLFTHNCQVASVPGALAVISLAIQRLPRLIAVLPCVGLALPPDAAEPNLTGPERLDLALEPACLFGDELRDRLAHPSDGVREAITSPPVGPASRQWPPTKRSSRQPKRRHSRRRSRSRRVTSRVPSTARPWPRPGR
jgi:hypothetical protein